MKTLRVCIQYILLLLVITLPLALVWSAVHPADYRLIPRCVNGAISLLAVPFQVVFAFLHLDNIHDIGIPAKTLGVISLELILGACLRLLRSPRRSEVQV
jgi:hypothetical protein